MFHFGCSAMEDDTYTYRIRPYSKLAFAIVFLPSLCLIAYKTATIPSNITNSISINATEHFNSTDCFNICPSANESMIDPALQEFCGSLWMQMGSPTQIGSSGLTVPHTHLTFLSILIAMFTLSTFEGLVEMHLSWSPYRLLYKGTNLLHENNNKESSAP